MAFEKPQAAPAQGLKQLRNNPHAQPTLCLNCKCSRYGACGCTKKGHKVAQ